MENCCFDSISGSPLMLLSAGREGVRRGRLLNIRKLVSGTKENQCVSYFGKDSPVPAHLCNS